MQHIVCYRHELNFILLYISTLTFPRSTVTWSLLVEVWSPQTHSGHRSDTPCLKNTIFPHDFAIFLVGQMQHPRVPIGNVDFENVLMHFLKTCCVSLIFCRFSCPAASMEADWDPTTWTYHVVWAAALFSKNVCVRISESSKFMFFTF